jgi:tetratricopeptide (TPR) repeat protein
MNRLAKALSIYLLCLGLLGSAGGTSAQVVGSSHKRVAQDPEAARLDNLVADAQAALDRKDYASAAADYQSYLEKRSDDAAVHFQLGYAFTALGKLDDAKVQYQKAIDLNPKMAEAYLNLGLTLLDSDPDAAIAPLQKAAELLPNQHRPKFALGAAYERSKRPSQALEQYQVAEKLDDQDFDTHLALGRLLLSANRSTEAEPEFRTALNIRPDSAPARFGLAHSLAAQKKNDAAARELQAYLALVPNDRAAQLEQASLLFNAGQLDESLAELDRAAAGGPEDLPALKLRALVYMQKNQFAPAVAVLLKASALAPKDPDLPAELGHAYLKKKDYPSAVQELVVAINANPKSIDVLNDLVVAEYLNKNYGAALAGLDILAKHEDLPFGSWFIRATCYDKLGQAAPALDAYQKFLRLNKDETSDMYFEAAARARTLARELKDKKR